MTSYLRSKCRHYVETLLALLTFLHCCSNHLYQFLQKYCYLHTFYIYEVIDVFLQCTTNILPTCPTSHQIFQLVLLFFYFWQYVLHCPKYFEFDECTNWNISHWKNNYSLAWIDENHHGVTVLDPYIKIPNISPPNISPPNISTPLTTNTKSLPNMSLPPRI